jgi:hypothetical protein
MLRASLLSSIGGVVTVVGCGSTSPDGGATADAATIGGQAGAAVACASLPNPLYIDSGDTQVPILKELGKKLRHAAEPATLVWLGRGSCTIIEALYAGTPLTQTLSYIPEDSSWDPAIGATPTCSVPAGGVSVDLGIPIVFPDSCTATPPPAGLKTVEGPVQSFVFVVPRGTAPQAISAEEAYLVFGFGATGLVTPWLDDMFYFVRPPTKGTQVSLGATIGVPAGRWKGQRIDQSAAVATLVGTSASPEKTIGILGTEVYDSAANRAALKSLAFQAYKQEAGYLPDSSPVAFDKRNVRDGHYPAWSHVFYLAPADASGTPKTAGAQTVIDVLTQGPRAAALGIDVIDLVARKGLVPGCAMNVRRSREGGDLSPYVADDPCGCAYEAKVGTAPAACMACTDDGPCGTGRCRHGFCEAADGRTALGDCPGNPASPVEILNAACPARFSAARRPVPQKQTDNGGQLPPLP